MGWQDVPGPARVAAWTLGLSALAASHTGSLGTWSTSRKSAAMAARPHGHLATAAAPACAPAAAVALLAHPQRVWRNKGSRAASDGQVSMPRQHEKPTWRDMSLSDTAYKVYIPKSQFES